MHSGQQLKQALWELMMYCKALTNVSGMHTELFWHLYDVEQKSPFPPSLQHFVLLIEEKSMKKIFIKAQN